MDDLENRVISPILDFDKDRDVLAKMDFTDANTELTNHIYSDTALFSKWVEDSLSKKNARYGIGGYGENRQIYSRSTHFDSSVGEPRRLHLGTDIWAPALTTVYSPLPGIVHSFKFNGNFGDYGGTIILEHSFSEATFFTLYGHLSLQSLQGLTKGHVFEQGSVLANLGVASENGNWPPHLHFQIILDLQGMEGDYPGVCRMSEREHYLKNCPDPAIILRHTFE